MSASTPLQGAELISCAKASAKQGIQAAAEQCGYGRDTARFESVLRETCDKMGIEIESLNSLVTEQQRTIEKGMVDIAPDSFDGESL